MKSLLWLENRRSIPEEISVELPLSKSISNRVLILNAISIGKIYSQEYSQASDTRILQKCLEDLASDEYDVQDAGTSFRFMTALAAIGDHEVIITGTERMKKRPLRGLADIIQKLGAEITFMEQNGFPPIKIKPPKKGLHSQGKVNLKDTSSSQFISALMLIAPKIKGGLYLSFPKNIPSYSYIQMTAEIMKSASIEVKLDNDSIEIPEQNLSKNIGIEIERDWSGASYFFSVMALGNWPKMLLTDLKLNSIQKDNRICEYFKPLGINAIQTEDGVVLSKKEQEKIAHQDFDFRDNPDLAMTVIVAYALKKVDLRVSGIENLVIKESNRIDALKTELEKINVKFVNEGEFWYLKTSGLTIPSKLSIKTYSDHRIAMAFSVLALMTKVCIENPNVVNKSFPNFWNQLNALGLSTDVI